jgi:pyruvate-formate lyase-activating enzyme
VAALFAAIRQDPALAGLTCFIDSNGHLGAQGWRQLLPLTDGVMLDIKAFDPALHLGLTGRDNARSLNSARITHAAGKLYELRYLMLPGQTDTPEEIAHLIRFADELGGPLRIRLNAFHAQGVRGKAGDWPSMPRPRVEAVADQLRQAGLGPVILPAVWL